MRCVFVTFLYVPGRVRCSGCFINVYRIESCHLKRWYRPRLRWTYWFPRVLSESRGSLLCKTHTHTHLHTNAHHKLEQSWTSYRSYLPHKPCSNTQHVSLESRSWSQALWMCYLIQVVPWTHPPHRQIKSLWLSLQALGCAGEQRSSLRVSMGRGWSAGY